MSRSNNIEIKDIWKLTKGGEDIFRQVLGEFTTEWNLSAPWRKDDVPSMRLKDRNGVIYYQDYGGDQSSGSALDFLMKLHGITLPQAVEMVKKGIPEGAVKQEREGLGRDPVIYEFNDMPFSRLHHKYWNQYELTEEFVTGQGDIYAVRKWACNKKIQEITQDEVVFGFIYRDDRGNDTGLRKMLRIGPEVDKKDKWRTNVSNTQLWYTYKYVGKEIKQLFISKSNKDALCTMQFDIPSIPTQSENDVILSQNIPYLKSICPNLILNFGSDPQGTQASINVSKEYGLAWFNTPKSYLDYGVNDNAEYIKEFGKNCFKDLLIKKKYL